MTFNTLVDNSVDNFKTFASFIQDDYRRDVIKMVEAQAEYVKSVYNFNKSMIEKNQSFFELGNIAKK